MGRKSALTPDQWVEIERRALVGGESVNSLAKEFKVDESTIRKKINPNKSGQDKSAKSLSALAIEKIEADKKAAAISDEISTLPVARQEIVVDLVRKFSNIGEHMFTGVELSAETFSILSAAANAEARKADRSDPKQFADQLQKVADITEVANEAARTPINLIAANKDMMKQAQKDAPVLPVRVVVAVEDASLPDA